MDQRSKEWFDARKGKITGSRIGAILGLSPFQSRNDVMRSMVREWHGAESEFTGNEATDWGTEQEEVAVAEYEVVTGNIVQLASVVRHPEMNWLQASPDGLLGDGGALEVKCPYYAMKHGVALKSIEQLPHYVAQCQLVMACADLDWIDFYQWTPNGDKLERMERDREWLAQYMPTLQNFYDEFTQTVSCKEKSAIHLSDAEVTLSGAKTKADVHEYLSLQKRAAGIKEKLDEVKERLLGHVVDDRIHRGFGIVISSKTRTTFDKKRLSEDHPEIDLSQYNKVGNTYREIRAIKEKAE